MVKSDSYRRQLVEPRFPKLANAFLCSGLILESAGNYGGAGWAGVHAAWACDDADLREQAGECRKRAVTMFMKAREASQKLVEEPGGAELLIADLSRRAGDFQEAVQACDEGLGRSPAPGG